MCEFSYMPMFWQAFFSDTEALHADAAKAYLFLIGHAWIRGAKLPDDDEVLARLARVTLRRWGELKTSVMALWFKDDNGDWTQKRMLAEYVAVKNKVEINRKNGSKGGRPKYAKKHNRINESSKPTGFPSRGPSPAPIPPLREELDPTVHIFFENSAPIENSMISTKPPNPTVTFGLDMEKEYIEDSPPPTTTPAAREEAEPTKGGGDVIKTDQNWIKFEAAYRWSPSMSRRQTKILFAALAPIDQTAAIVAIPGFREGTKKQSNPTGAEKYLRERLFDNCAKSGSYSDAKRATEPTVRVHEDHVNWKIFDKLWRREHDNRPLPKSDRDESWDIPARYLDLAQAERERA